MKLLITIEYKGKSFCGWQSQPNKRTIQGEIENSLLKIFGDKIKVYGSGRTDTGVHAIAQTAHFEIDKHLFEKKFNRKTTSNNDSKKENNLLLPFILAINSLLPCDIKILKVKKVKDTFHSRFDAKEKIYLYKIEQGKPFPSPLSIGLTGFCKQSLDIEKMKEGAAYLIGTHDFTSFSSAKTEVTNFIRTINYIKIKKCNNNIITFEISGNGFLYNMVRIIIGTLVDIGTYKTNPEHIKTILESKSRPTAGKTISPSGLYLKKVIY